MDGAPLDHDAPKQRWGERTLSEAPPATPTAAEAASAQTSWGDPMWGDQPFGAPMPRAFRLADAERIAASRLEGAAEGSLKEALATHIVEPLATGRRLLERLQQIAAAGQASIAAAPADAAADAALVPVSLAETPAPAVTAASEPPANAEAEPIAPRLFQAVPEADFGWLNAVPPAHAVPFFEDREPGEDWARETAALMPAPVSASGWAVAPAAPVAPASLEMSGAAASIPTVMPVEAPRPAAEVQADEAAPVVTDAMPNGTAAVVEEDTHADARVIFSDTPDLTPPADAGALPEDPNLEPIVTAYAASARLAADAAAASQALFELQKLLNDQLLEASPELNQAMEAHGFASLASIPAAGQPEPGADVAAASAADDEDQEPFIAEAFMAALAAQPSTAPPPLPPAQSAALRDVPPEDMPKCVVGPAAPSEAPRQVQAAYIPAPLPQPVAMAQPAAVQTRPQRPQARLVAAAKSGASAPAARTNTSRRAAAPMQSARRTRAAFDFRGFAAGFALSGAIGLVLYFVMSTS